MLWVWLVGGCVMGVAVKGNSLQKPMLSRFYLNLNAGIGKTCTHTSDIILLA